MAAPTGDALWSANFGDPGFGSSNFALNAVAISGSNVFVGGSFHTFGWQSTVNYNNIAEWDGHGWHPLGAGTSGGTNSGQVNALAVLGSDLYVGGTFTTAGAVSVKGVAKWNPTGGWSAPGGGVTDTSCCWVVNALAARGTAASPTVYVGGNFANIGNTAVSNIAKWNGTSWAPMGSGLTGGAGEVYALASSGSTLYAGGSFSQSGTTKFNSLAAWDGTTWAAVGGAGISTSFGSPGTVRALTVDPATGTLYVGGQFAEVGGTLSFGSATGATAANNVASYNGSWNTLAGGIGHPVGGLAWYNGKLYASYSSSSLATISQWNGTSWSPLAAPLGGGVAGSGPVLRAGTGGVIAAGNFLTGGNAVLNLVGRWTGSKWQTFGLGVPNQITAFAGSNQDLYAAGSFTNAGSAEASSIAHFDGTSWHPMGTSGIVGAGGTCASSGRLSTICAVAIDPASHHVFIGGSFTSINGVPANNVAMWDGSSWHPLGQGTDGVVEALLVYGGKLYAGGQFGHADGNPANDVAQWNLASGGWTALGDNVTFATSGGAEGYVNALAGVNYGPSFNHDVLIGGGFEGITDGTNGVVTNGLVLFDTTASYTSPTAGYYYFGGNNGGSAGVGGAGVVYALTTSGSKLYIGGNFSFAGGLTAGGFAVFDLSNTTDTGWSAPGTVTGHTSSVYAIAKAGSSYFLGGNFTSAGGVAANNIAQYTPGAGTEWGSLGNGIGGSGTPSVVALASTAEGLFAGGDIGMAGATTPSAGVALWTATALQLGVTNVASPSPTSVGTNTTFTATVTNTGTTSASGVTMKDTVPANATYVSATPSTGTCSLSSGTVVCQLGSLAAGASDTVSIVLTPNATGKLTDTARFGESGTTFTNNATASDAVH